MDGLWEFAGGYFGERLFRRLARHKCGLIALFVAQTVLWHLAFMLLALLLYTPAFFKGDPRMLSGAFWVEGLVAFASPPIQPAFSLFCMVLASGGTFSYWYYRRRLERQETES